MVDYEKLRTKIQDMVEDVYDEIKAESKDYGELRNKCKQYYTGMIYRDKNIGAYVKERFEILIEHELRNAPIVHF